MITGEEKEEEKEIKRQERLSLRRIIIIINSVLYTTAKSADEKQNIIHGSSLYKAKSTTYPVEPDASDQELERQEHEVYQRDDCRRVVWRLT